MLYKDEKYLVMGLSKSGDAAARLLLKHGAIVYIYDQMRSPPVEKVATSLIAIGAKRVSAESLDRVLERITTLVLSPGVAIDNSVAVRARAMGKRIIGELELGSKFLRAPMIAVTGTNGKTTTVCMIESVLKEAGIDAVTMGNIGIPICKRAEEVTENSVAVVEVSSFQLETVASFAPHIAVLLNITEDHLNRHYNMNNYVYLKKRVFSNLRESEYAVINDDCSYLVGIEKDLRTKVVRFSARKPVNGAYIQEGRVYFGGEVLFSVDDLALKEAHNVENALAAITVAKLMGAENAAIERALSNFRGAKHRMELVCVKGGITFVNDSKATNTDAAIAAARCMKKDTVILLGGRDKGYSYRSFFEELMQTRVRYAVLYGENRMKMLEDAVQVGFRNYSLLENLEQAVSVAQAVAKEGEVVLLSPAAASFDAFNGYDERGDAFVRYVCGEEDAKKKV